MHSVIVNCMFYRLTCSVSTKVYPCGSIAEVTAYTSSYVYNEIKCQILSKTEKPSEKTKSRNRRHSVKFDQTEREYRCLLPPTNWILLAINCQLWTRRRLCQEVNCKRLQEFVCFHN